MKTRNTNNPNKESGGELKKRLKAVFYSVIALGICFSISKLSQYKYGFQEPEDVVTGEGQDLEHFGSGRHDIEYYPIPEITEKEKKFCRGFQRADSCIERPLNPYYESKMYYGQDLPTIDTHKPKGETTTKNRLWKFFD